MLVDSIQSLTSYDKTPTAESFAPLTEKPKVSTIIPPPRESDFNIPERDAYSDMCFEQLEKLDIVEEERESDVSAESINVNPPKSNNVTIKLQPLDLKVNEPVKETKLQQQKLTTPGKT